MTLLPIKFEERILFLDEEFKKAVGNYDSRVNYLRVTYGLTLQYLTNISRSNNWVSVAKELNASLDREKVDRLVKFLEEGTTQEEVTKNAKVIAGNILSIQTANTLLYKDLIEATINELRIILSKYGYVLSAMSLIDKASYTALLNELEKFNKDVSRYTTSSNLKQILELSSLTNTNKNVTAEELLRVYHDYNVIVNDELIEGNPDNETTNNSSFNEVLSDDEQELYNDITKYKP